MRTSAVVTVSLPPALIKASNSLAKRCHMTRSELVRNLLRNALAEQETDEAIKVFDREKAEDKLTTLKGSLADLITVGNHDIYR